MRPFSELTDEDDQVDRVRYLLYGERRSIERVMAETGLTRDKVIEMSETEIGRRIDRSGPAVCTIEELQAHATMLLDASVRYGGSHVKKNVKFPGGDVLARKLGVDNAYLKRALAGTVRRPVKARNAVIIMNAKREDVIWQPETERVIHLIECRRDRRATRLNYGHGEKWFYARFMVERYGWVRYEVASVFGLSHHYVARIFEAVLLGPEPIPLLRDDLVALVPAELDGKASHG